MIDQFIKQLGTGLEQAANTLGKLPAEEIQAQLQQVAKDTLTKMDLVDGTQSTGYPWVIG